MKKLLLLALAVAALIPSCGSNLTSSNTPTNVTAAVVGSGTVNLSWTNAANASSYIVYYGTASNLNVGLSNFVGRVTSFSNSAVISGLTNGTVYYFVVTSVSSTGQSGQSVTVSATPQPTLILTPTVKAGSSAGSMVVSWTAVTGATAYNIFYSSGTDLGVAGTAWPSVAPPATSATITGLASGTTYYFTVTASVPSTSGSGVAP